MSFWLHFFATFLLEIAAVCTVIYTHLSFLQKKYCSRISFLWERRKIKQKFCRLIYSSTSDAEARGMLFSWLGHKIDLPLKMLHIIALYCQTPKCGSIENQSSLTNAFDKAITNEAGNGSKGCAHSCLLRTPKGTLKTCFTVFADSKCQQPNSLLQPGKHLPEHSGPILKATIVGLVQLVET